jgi:hypothetical protein
MTTRKYSSRAQQTTLSSGITSGDTTMTVGSGANLMGGKTPAVGETYTVVIDPDTALEEIVDVSNYSSGNTLTIARGIDGSTGVAHSAGAIVRHMVIGRDLSEANTHIEATTGHGATGAVVGTTNIQTIVNKDLSSATNTLSGSVVTLTGTQTLTNKSLTSPTITGTGAIAGTFTGNVTGNVTGNLTGNVTGNVTGSVSGNAGTVTNGIYTTDTGTVTSTMIANGTIVNADINASAAIDKTKISGTAVTTADTGTVTSTMIVDDTIVDADINSAAAISKTKISGTAITAADTGTVTSTMIADSTIVNADINSSAQIAYGKLNLANSIVDADVNASAAITKTKISGTAITAADTGTVTSTMIADGTIVNGDINSAAAIALSKLATDPLARANHTGTQLAATVSDFDTQVRTSKVTDLTAPTGSFSMNSQKITSLGTPTLTTDAATKAYADLMIPLTQKGVANGVAELDADGLVPVHHLPALSITTTQVVATQAAMLALTAQTGDVAVRTDVNKSFILTTTPATTLGNWQELLTPTDAVLSVDGQTGTVSLSSTYATVANAANKLPLAGGTMSGAIAMGTSKITGLGTPTTGTDAATKDYADTMLPLAGGTMSGAIAMGTNKITGVGNPTNAQDVVTKNYLDTTVLAPSNLTGPITSVANATSIASQTGTGTKFVMDTSPTLVTPTLGVATATSVNGTTIPTSKTLVATDSTTYVVPSQTGNSGKYLTTDGTTSSWGTVTGYSAPTLGSTSIASGATVSNVDGLTINSTTVPTSKTLVVTTDKLSVHAATSSSELAGVISDETGSGSLVFANTPTLITPILGVASATSVNGTTIPSSKVLVDTDTAQTLTNKTLTGPVINLTTSAQTASYTLVFGDTSDLVEMSNASANNLTVPLNSSVAFPVGTQIHVLQTGAGQTTIVATSGVTINSATGLKLRAQWSSATLIKRATDTWVAVGDLSA